MMPSTAPVLCLLACLAACTAFVPPTMSLQPQQQQASSRASFLRNGAAAVAAGAVCQALASPAFAAKYQSEYLTEPTAEFKALAEQQEAFAKKMRAYKAEYANLEAKFVAADTDESISSAILALQNLVMSKGQLPEGKQPADVFKVSRKKRAAFKQKNMWGTKVDIVYEEFVRNVNKTKKPDNSGGGAL
eukprot:TRINITY_DN9224_c0_g1_i2.p1 TRINITY_DN9224_c0_g1~~TRINITY_DN9224_c0_g1_i2.p1  ORF type:complete len:189 (-),score=69.50 TRINITY_DN9224_c0_g1_i2:3-569(-)